MKKLLLVLLIVALASFLFAGCLPVTPSEGEGEGEGEPEPAVTITVEDEYLDPVSGDIYIRCDDLLFTVTFAEAVAADQDVWIKLTDGKGESGWIPTSGTGTEFTTTIPVGCALEGCPDCEPICIEVMVGDVCCSETIYHEVRIVDSKDPLVALYLTVEDCGPCDDMANISFTSSKIGECDVEDTCCDDDCSGVAGWTVTTWAGREKEVNTECDTPCYEASGVCPIEGSTGCLDCLVFDAVYWVEVTFYDNVGNGSEWDFEIELDEDSFVGFDTDESIRIIDMCDA